MNPLTKLLEAAFYCASRPLTVNELKALDPSVSKGAIQAAIEELKQQYDSAEHGVELVQVAEGYQILTRPEYADAITQARISQRPRRLSVAALETLAIIGYRQPVGRAEIEEIRGVAADGVLRSLVERGLVDVAGRGEGLGRPLLYGTTPRFLEMLGLSDISELPRLDELAVALQPVVDRGFDDGDDQARSEAESGHEHEPTLERRVRIAEPAETNVAKQDTANDIAQGEQSLGDGEAVADPQESLEQQRPTE